MSVQAKLKWHWVVLMPGFLVAACGRPDATSSAAAPPEIERAPTAAPAPPPASAVATLKGAQGSGVQGQLRLTATEGGVFIAGEVNGLNPNSSQGVHVHEKGDCMAPDLKSAGDHFNPSHTAHGGPEDAVKHLGDMPNLAADGTGNAAVNATIVGATLRDGGANDLVGRAVIVHAKRDDYMTQPAGDSGDRVACGVIE